MATALATIQELDFTGIGIGSWQLMKSRTIAQAVATAAQLTTNCREIGWDTSTQPTVEYFPTAGLGGLQVMNIGTASDNNAPVTDIYGFPETGPGYHSGVVTCTFSGATSAATTGFHASTQTNKGIRGAFLPGTAYRVCDTYVETFDYDGSIVVPAAQETDLPASYIISLLNTKYAYVAMLVSVLNSATNVGAICRPISVNAMLAYGT